MMKKKMIITIDGPAGSGKSSVAKEIAEKLNIYYLNSGLLYRSVAYLSLNNIKILNLIKDLEYIYKNNKSYILYKNQDITDKLYTGEISNLSSKIAEQKEIRENLLNFQQNLAKNYSLIADGRDCGSVVFPDANYKFFLTASLDIRAKRIFLDKNRDNKSLNLDQIKQELELRDQRDINRKIAPLIIPKDSIIIDNSDLTKQETVNKILSYIKLK